MDESDIAEYVDRSQSVLDSTPQMDEQNTKVKLVQPLIQLLGWDIYSPDVELEYPIKMGTSHTRVDYALLLDGTPAVFVEAKGCDTTVTDSHREQLGSYMRQKGADWGLLTNGKTFEMLRRKKDTDRPQEISFGEFQLEELPENTHFLQTLSRESIESGDAEVFAENIAARKRAIARLREQKSDIAEQITEILTDSVGDIVDQEAQARAKQLVDELIEDVQGELKPDSGGSKPTTPPDGRIDIGSHSDITEWTPREGANAIAGTISRRRIAGDDDAAVAVFPTKKSGLQFLQENNAWGFVRVGRDPEFVGMYVTEGESEVRYIAKLEGVRDPEQVELARPVQTYTGEQAEFGSHKKVLVFEPGSLYELEDPIPFESQYPQGLRYTTLGQFRTAETTDDII